MNKVTVRTYSRKIDADLAKLRLDDIGIKSEVVVIDILFSGALGGYELRVDAGQSSRAEKFIEAYEKSLSEALDEMDDEDFK